MKGYDLILVTRECVMIYVYEIVQGLFWDRINLKKGNEKAAQQILKGIVDAKSMSNEASCSPQTSFQLDSRHGAKNIVSSLMYSIFGR